METAATRIRRERKARGWSQDKLAAHLGTSRKTVIAWEKHGDGPAEGYAGELARLFGGPMEDYLGPKKARRSSLDEDREALAEIVEGRLGPLEDAVEETRADLSALREAVESLLHHSRPNQGAG